MPLLGQHLHQRWLTPAPDWHQQAACRNHPQPDLWFSTHRPDQQEAKAICRTCPAFHRCRDYALANIDEYGIWGGLTEGERRERRRLRRRIALRGTP